MKIQSMLIIFQVLNEWRKLKNILNTNNKRVRTEAKSLGAISANGNVTLQIFEETLIQKVYREIK